MFVKSVRCLGGTAPTLTLRNGLVQTYTAALATSEVVCDLTAPVVGRSYPVNRWCTQALHATVGGTSPLFEIEV